MNYWGRQVKGTENKNGKCVETLGQEVAMVGIKEDYKSSSYRYIDKARFIPIQRNFNYNYIKLSKIDGNKFMGGKKKKGDGGIHL